jgi:glycogen(starch) synthase
MSVAGLDPLRRILVLVPHEPELDPRVAWSLRLCRALGPTDVIATTWSSTKPAREFDGTVAIERIDATTYASPSVLRASARLGKLEQRRPAREFIARHGRPPHSRGRRRRLRHHLGAAYRLVAAWSYYAIILSALFRRGRAVSVPPTVILCHDLYALIPAARLKRRFGCALVYDSHEYFPESDLLAPSWQRRLVGMLERRYIRDADAVVAVSPPLAEEMRRRYRLDRVIAVPNAEPLPEQRRVLRVRRASDPVRFLIQGQAAPGRGFERLFELWSAIGHRGAVLQVRCPDGEYPAQLRRQFAELFSSGRAEWVAAVPEDELIDAASAADVGVIPYVGPSLNHLYASPNKLSQYMQAGLAIFANDLPYISSLVRRFDCGVTYRADADTEAFAAVVARLLDRAELERLQQNALAATAEFNWETVSMPYAEALADLWTP